MINLQRAERKTEFWKSHYGDKVGPGMYNKNAKSQFNKQNDRYELLFILIYLLIDIVLLHSTRLK